MDNYHEIFHLRYISLLLTTYRYELKDVILFWLFFKASSHIIPGDQTKQQNIELYFKTHITKVFKYISWQNASF